jgi:hypothetical protein
MKMLNSVIFCPSAQYLCDKKNFTGWLGGVEYILVTV